MGKVPSTAMIDCVFLSCFEHDVRLYAGLLAYSGIRVHHADTVEMADFLFLATSGTVLLLDTVFLDGCWEDALAMMRNLHPLVACVLSADPVDREFVASAPAHGVFDVLWRPLELDRLRAAICRANEITSERRIWAAAQVGPGSLPAPACP